MKHTSNPKFDQALEAYKQYCLTTEFLPNEQRLTEDNLTMYHPVHGDSKYVSDRDFAARLTATANERRDLGHLEDAIVAACQMPEDCLSAGEQIVKFMGTEAGQKEAVRGSFSHLIIKLRDRHIETQPPAPAPRQRYAKIPRNIIRHSREYRWAAAEARMPHPKRRW